MLTFLYLVNIWSDGEREEVEQKLRENGVKFQNLERYHEPGTTEFVVVARGLNAEDAELNAMDFLEDGAGLKIRSACAVRKINYRESELI